ncbi:hypothetical protein ABIA35_005950 [Catenulispora sp. MAP12-49]|uniref:hypothetical protein n=1 Tax=unclassified Catenulispora TaxID=414885 RepID=UPI0035128254
MRYSLVFEMVATEIIATLPEVPHELFTLACFDIVDAPYGQGGVPKQTSDGVIRRAWAVGDIGLIEYQIDEKARVVTIISVTYVQ